MTGTTREDAVELLKLIRKYPDFDDPDSLLGHAIDQYLAGQRPDILGNPDRLAGESTKAQQRIRLSKQLTILQNVLAVGLMAYLLVVFARWISSYQGHFFAALFHGFKP